MSALDYPFAEVPAPGATLEVAPGVRWLSMPLPFQLDHINLWLLDDGPKENPSWLIIDTGLGNEPTRALWAGIFADKIGVRPVKRVLVTHYHPDHAGNAAWLCGRANAELWMTRGDLYRRLVPDFPMSHRRLHEGERITVGGCSWRVIVGHGHAPEHVSLHCETLNLLISGDMLLPRITTNVAVRPIDPWSNPLRLFLDSIRRYRELPEDILVLPSHGLPFRGAHARIAQLEAHHAQRLAELQAACTASPRTAAEALEILFRRKLDTDQIFFAMGEAIAHLHYLHYDGRLARTVGADGVARFAPE